MPVITGTDRLTPDAVQAVTFPSARLGRRGLDEDHVRAFCGQVERELVRLFNERTSLTDEVQRLRQAGARPVRRRRRRRVQAGRRARPGGTHPVQGAADRRPLRGRRPGVQQAARPGRPAPPGRDPGRCQDARRDDARGLARRGQPGRRGGPGRAGRPCRRATAGSSRPNWPTCGRSATYTAPTCTPTSTRCSATSRSGSAPRRRPWPRRGPACRARRTFRSLRRRPDSLEGGLAADWIAHPACSQAAARAVWRAPDQRQAMREDGS